MSRRNPKVGVMIETGTHYAEYRSIMIRGHCEIIEEPSGWPPSCGKVRPKTGVCRETMQCRAVPRDDVVSRAPKRVAPKITPEKVAIWDHSKLGGQY